MLKSTAAILVAAMFVGDRTTASPSLAEYRPIVRVKIRAVPSSLLDEQVESRLAM